MHCWNNRLLKNTLYPLKTKQRYQSQLLDFCLRESKDRKKSMEELMDLHDYITE